jgi:hypothetical protein
MVKRYASGREFHARVDDSQAVAAEYRYESYLIWMRAIVPIIIGDAARQLE